jgi:hypothetical protein
MAGFFLYSLDADAFEQLTTAPTKGQCLAAADAVLDDLEDLLSEYDGDDAADPDKWPLDRLALAKAVRKRLVSPDWYVDLTLGDGAIWSDLVFQLIQEDGTDFRNENDGFLYWDAAATAAKNGAPTMAEPSFGRAGYRYTGVSVTDLDLMYTVFEPDEVQQLLDELEVAAPHFEALPATPEGDRDQFFRGLLEPVRRVAAEGRVLWVQTDT